MLNSEQWWGKKSDQGSGDPEWLSQEDLLPRFEVQ